jgi:hypothetical protein
MPVEGGAAGTYQGSELWPREVSMCPKSEISL